MLNQTRRIWAKLVENYGPVTLLAADGSAIGKIEFGRWEDWQLVECAGFFYHNHKSYTRTGFQEFMHRQLMPGNAIQIG